MSYGFDSIRFCLARRRRQMQVSQQTSLPDVGFQLGIWTHISTIASIRTGHPEESQVQQKTNDTASARYRKSVRPQCRDTLTTATHLSVDFVPQDLNRVKKAMVIARGSRVRVFVEILPETNAPRGEAGNENNRKSSVTRRERQPPTRPTGKTSACMPWAQDAMGDTNVSARKSG